MDLWIHEDAILLFVYTLLSTLQMFCAILVR